MKTENIKTVEIRDHATLIPAFAIKMLPGDEKELHLFKNVGYRNYLNPCILLVSIASPWLSSRSSNEWPEGLGRSFEEAHKWIEKNFDDIKNGDVVDVEFIVGEKDKPSLNSYIEEKLNEKMD